MEAQVKELMAVTQDLNNQLAAMKAQADRINKKYAKKRK